MYGIIYTITYIKTNKTYVGQTIKSLYERRKGHEKNAYYGSDTHICRAFRKYGFDAFEWRIIDEADSKEELDILEKFYIKLLDTRKHGYNMTDGGDGINNPDMCIRKKISIARQKQSPPRLGMITSEETKHRMRHKHSKHFIKDIVAFGDARKGWHHSDDYKNRLKIETKRRKHIRKDDEEKFVFIDEIATYIDDGWVLGRLIKIKETI